MRLAVLVLAVVLGGCTVALPRESVVVDNQKVAAEKIALPNHPTHEAKISGARITDDDLQTSFGRLHVVRVESDATKPLIVFCGGNAFREESVGGLTAAALAPFGDVLLFDYPGYGASEGHATRGDFAIAEAALSAKVKALAGTRQVIFWGHSLGGGVCASLAASTPVEHSALVLVATFAQYEDIKHDMLGLASGIVSLKVSEDTVAYDLPALLKPYRGPIVVVALSKDETIPFAVSEELAKRLSDAGKAVRFVRLEGKGHSAIHGHPDFRERVKAALVASGIETGP